MPVSSVALSPSLQTALTRAGERNNVDFSYLLQTAIRESALDPEARAATSSAVGLFQFVEQTWLETVKEQGPALGYGHLADKINRTADGGFVVEDPRLRAQILALREDPQMAADLAAAFTRANGEYLAQRFGRMPSPGELYIAHFLGSRGAERFFEIGLTAPDSIAANSFPRQAEANPSIFFDDGRPRTVREVYRLLVASHSGDSTGAAFAAQQMAGGSADFMLPSVAMSFTGLYQAAGVQTAAPVSAPPTVTASDPRPSDQEFTSFFNRLVLP